MMMGVMMTAGCQSQEQAEANNENIQSVKQINYSHPLQMELNDLLTKEFSEVEKLTSITNNNEQLIAIQVSPFYQFTEQAIEADITSYLKTQFPDIQPSVSSDYKMFLEIDRLKAKLEEDITDKQTFDQLFKQLSEQFNS